MMKTIFTVLIAISSLLLQAQNFTFEPTNTLEKIIAIDDASDLLLDIIRNEEVDTLRLSYELVTNSIPEEWYSAYCDNHGCYSTLPENGSMSPMYEDMLGFVKLIIDPNNIEGDAMVQYYIYEDNDYENGQTMTFIIHTPNAVGIENTAKINFNIYPNPVINSLSINTEESIFEIGIYNILGHQIFSLQPNQNSNLQINTQAWSTGIYFLELTNKNGVKTTRKFVKK